MSESALCQPAGSAVTPPELLTGLVAEGLVSSRKVITLGEKNPSFELCVWDELLQPGGLVRLDVTGSVAQG